jgi:hypothetical protein
MLKRLAILAVMLSAVDNIPLNHRAHIGLTLLIASGA